MFKFEQKSHLFYIGILFTLGYFLLMMGNGIISLTHPDEVFYIQSAREMVKHNSFLTPMIFDHVQFEKPFLAFSLFALGIKYFGLSPFVARFWPAFFGILGMGVTYWIAYLLYNKKRLAFIAGMITGSSFIHMVLSRAVLTDMIFSVMVSASIGFFYYAYRYKESERTGLILSFLICAIAVLTKGFLGFTFLKGTILFFLLFRKDLTFLKNKSMLMGIFLFLLIALPWHILMFKNHGYWFIDEYVNIVHIKRLFVAEHAKLDNWYFYIALMFAGVLPWSLFWAPTIHKIFMERKTQKRFSCETAFLLSWILGVYVFVQPAHSKLASYIFPVFPAVAILLANYLDGAIAMIQTKGTSLSLKLCGYFMSVIFIGVAMASVLFGRYYIQIVDNGLPVIVFSLLMVLTSLLIFYFNRRGDYVKMIFSCLGVNVAILAGLFLGKPAIEPWVSCKDVSRVLRQLDQSDTVVLASKFYVRGIRYYTQRQMAVIDINGKGFFSPHPIPFLNTKEKLIDFVNSQNTTFAVLKEANVTNVHEMLDKRKFRISDLGGMGGKFIVKIEKIL